MKQTISELTGGIYNELRYNSAVTPYNGPCMTEICLLLGKCGIDISVTDVYDETVEDAVRQFQDMVGMRGTGILNDNTLQAMIYYADRISDIVEESIDEEDGVNTKASDSPHYNSFFDTDKYKLHRRNHKDIKIVLGNNSVVKTIKDVFMRSVTVEVDTSGNPISEVYEFIARDIKESDEISDVTKYNGEEIYASSDIKYVFNFHESSDDDEVPAEPSHGGGGRRNDGNAGNNILKRHISGLTGQIIGPATGIAGML